MVAYGRIIVPVKLHPLLCKVRPRHLTFEQSLAAVRAGRAAGGCCVCASAKFLAPRVACQLPVCPLVSVRRWTCQNLHTFGRSLASGEASV